MDTNNYIVLDNGILRLELCRPGFYYRGTRFDRAGVFRRIVYDGVSYCDEWFDTKPEDCHDHICGPSEEFDCTVGYESSVSGGCFLKPGVGLLLREDDRPYDRFHTYRIIDEGERDLVLNDVKAQFSHIMPAYYNYVKTVALKGGNCFEIRHIFLNTSGERMPLRQYNHNFFTFGLHDVGPERRVDWAFAVDGQRREDSVNVDRDSHSIWVTEAMLPGQKAFFGNLHQVDDLPQNCSFVLKAGEKSVSVKASFPMSSSVLWTNDRVFCPEPYIDLNLAPGETKEWTIEYTILPPCRNLPNK